MGDQSPPSPAADDLVGDEEALFVAPVDETTDQQVISTGPVDDVNDEQAVVIDAIDATEDSQGDVISPTDDVTDQESLIVSPIDISVDEQGDLFVPTDESDDESGRARLSVEIGVDQEVQLRSPIDNIVDSEVISNIPTEEENSQPSIPQVPSEDPVQEALIISGEQAELPELAPPVSEALDDFNRQKGIIIMRDGEDKLYTLVPILDSLSNKQVGPFIDRGDRNRFFG